MTNRRTDAKRATKARVNLLQWLMDNGYNCAVGKRKKNGEYWLVVNVPGKVTKKMKKEIPRDFDGFKVEIKEVGDISAPLGGNKKK